MTSEERRRLKAAVDARKRELVRRSKGRGCSGCGCDYDNQTVGCKQCWNRHNKHRLTQERERAAT